MTIRIGANPIGWSNDDMQEIGGWIPLEQCLSEAKEAGFVGMELGNKFPREAAKLQPILDSIGLALVGGWHSIFLLERDAETEFAEAAAHRKLLKDMGTDVFIVAECTRTVHGDKSKPLFERPVMTDEEWKPLHRAADAPRRAPERGRLPARLSSSHGHGDPDGRGDRPADGEYAGEPVGLLLDTGHATWGGADPAALAARIPRAHRPCALQGCAPRGPRRGRRRRTGRSSMRSSPASTRCRATAWSTMSRCSRNCPAIPAGSVVEAEQDPKKAEPAKYAKMGYAQPVSAS